MRLPDSGICRSGGILSSRITRTRYYLIYDASNRHRDTPGLSAAHCERSALRSCPRSTCWLCADLVNQRTSVRFRSRALGKPLAVSAGVRYRPLCRVQATDTATCTTQQSIGDEVPAPASHHKEGQRARPSPTPSSRCDRFGLLPLAESTARVTPVLVTLNASGRCDRYGLLRYRFESCRPLGGEAQLAEQSTPRA
jgi:hypothetical protein